MHFLVNFKYIIIFISLFVFSYKTFAEKRVVKEYGIVILLSEECASKAAIINKQIAGKLPHLENPSNEWHVTLYHAAFSEQYINELKNTIATISFKPIEIHFDKIYNSENRWIDFGIRKNSELLKLHTKVVKEASRYYQRELERVHDTYNALTDKKKAQVDEYGVHNVFADYKPHMTLFYQYPADPNLDQVAKTIAQETKPMKCMAAKVVIGELQYNGNLSNIVYEVNLPQK